MLEQITKQIYDKCICELNKEENKRFINRNIMSPLCDYIKLCIFPYVITLIIMILINIWLSLLILHKMKIKHVQI